MNHIRILFALMFACLAIPAKAQGTLPFALQQQFSFIGCTSAGNLTPCGTPLIGGLLYFYQANSLNVQNSFQDSGLTTTNPWPLTLDTNGRIPMFYLPSGSVHVRLTDSTGVVQFDNQSMLVLGATPGSGGGGGTVDPNTVASTGDVKWRPSADTLDGWVRLNGGTIGNGASGATERATADVQPLYTYLWTNFSSPSGNVKCAVSGGLGVSATADFNAGKAMALLDMRDKIAAGRDSMGGTAANGILAANVTSSGDGIDSAAGTGGEANHTLTVAEMPAHNHGGATGTATVPFGSNNGGITAGGTQFITNVNIAGLNENIPALSISSQGGGGTHNNMQPFMLGTWFMKL